MAKTKVILDFDRVLFDSDTFQDALFDAVKKFGVSREAWETAYAKRDEAGIFRIERQAELLAPGRAQDLVAAMEAEVDDALWYMFPDSRPFLERVSPAVDLHLLTRGDRSLQEAKVEATGIRPYFSDIHVVEEPKHEAKLPFPTVEHAVFINDDPREMTDLAGVYRWATHYHVDRGRSPLPTGSPFKSFGTLEEIAERLLGPVPR